MVCTTNQVNSKQWSPQFDATFSPTRPLNWNDRHSLPPLDITGRPASAPADTQRAREAAERFELRLSIIISRAQSPTLNNDRFASTILKVDSSRDVFFGVDPKKNLQEKERVKTVDQVKLAFGRVLEEIKSNAEQIAIAKATYKQVLAQVKLKGILSPKPKTEEQITADKVEKSLVALIPLGTTTEAGDKVVRNWVAHKGFAPATSVDFALMRVIRDSKSHRLAELNLERFFPLKGSQERVDGDSHRAIFGLDAWINNYNAMVSSSRGD